MSRRKRSLSSFSFDLMSHNRQRVRRDLVGDDDAHHLVFPQPSAFHLEIHKTDADAEEETREEIVDADGERHHVVDLLRRRPAERRDVLFRHHRIVELVVLVIEFNDRAWQLRAFLDTEARRERAGRDIAHHDLERNDLHFADQLLAHVQTADEMRRHADVVQILEYIFRNPVVQHAFAFNHFVFFGVEGGRIVLKMLDQRSWFGSFVQDLRLSFIDFAAAAHRCVPCLVKIHRTAGFRLLLLNPRRKRKTQLEHYAVACPYPWQASGSGWPVQSANRPTGNSSPFPECRTLP